ncbi:hypothetical protein COY93_03800 [Candidatus Uhrbacteria bacterium CG_4_10_14_0_8_um_filter_58_22]|uniref:Glycosyl transferase family 1 domain-containing protein n=1 Tax=Candidatus Uhrbacteria bacterium CG_4_10_14_0_8_um_filter_58_22 TaxID=1975029 RepID=A0A2M7QA00_9BACT|nr:MAG: hypothetical protein AUJ19_00645 [Parcubacteria group bacterium CG1_02_58_44]PIY62115.1 MAG: hypothetical protein COY93_03800 [Candidatus Uhrbacteria bacterium CG_4_10_14_0_8_um_filter_58_22]
MKPILIDCSLTGGRGPAKKTWELTQDLDVRGISYLVLTDMGFRHKLTDLGVRVDFVVEMSLNDDPSRIISRFYDVIKDIDYGFMLKFGARVAGPIASRMIGRPYVIVDGGLPDRLDEDEKSLYSRAVFQDAEKYLLTTQFDWDFPKSSGLGNVETCCYPISEGTFSLIEKMRGRSRLENLSAVRSGIDGELPGRKEDLLVDLVMTGDYLTPDNRIAYGGWLTAKQYDQSVGFVRRLFTDLGENFGEVYVFMDLELKAIVDDLINTYSNVKVSSFRSGWSFAVELTVKAAADVTISRATNYQPYIAALAKGGNVTTPVPADGYMDEDTAGVQYAEKGLTKLIAYDDERYIFRLKEFIENDREQQRIRRSLERNSFVKDRNLNKIIVDLCEKSGFCL